MTSPEEPQFRDLEEEREDDPSAPHGSPAWQKLRKLLRPVLWIASVPLAVVFAVPALVVALVTKLFERPMVRSRVEVAEILAARIALSGDAPFWDEFLACEIADPQLETIRRECLEIDQRTADEESSQFSAADVARIRKLLLTLEFESPGAAPLVN
ncbi:MAG: hypothetical protein AMXMBFR36_28790 [Acidobacteriota bacterium]